MVSKPRLHNPCGGHPSLDFVNSIGRSPGRTGRERLTDYGALLQWSVEAGTLEPAAAGALAALAAADPAAAATVLERARALREALFAIFHADLGGRPPPTAARATFDAELERALGHARVERRGDSWAWVWCDDRRLDAPLWPIARGAAELLVSPECGRIKECDSATCLWLFVDHSRNHRRRWCEMSGCGNRAKVRRHRRRKESAGG